MKRILLVSIATLSAAGVAISDDRTAQQKNSDIATANTITEITLTRSGSEKNGPEDILTLRRDGTFQYVGKKNVSRLGNFSGVIPEHYFGDAFRAIAENYIALRRHTYSTGKPSMTTSVKIEVIRAGKTDEITVWCPGLDRNLFAFEMSVRGVVADAKWSVAEE